MDKKKLKKEIYGSADFTKYINNFLLAQISILKGVAISKKITGRANEMRVVLMSSVGVVAAMANVGTLNETTMLVRAFLERVINFCYVVVCSDEEYGRYKAYSLQKSYRKLNRKISAGGHTFEIRYMGNIDANSIPELKAALEQFTGSRGGEKTRWTNVELSDRIIIIGKNSKIDIRKWLLALLTYYEDASEALHGTFYGSVFQTGMYEPGFDRNDKAAVLRNEQKKLTLLYWQMGDFISDLIYFLGEKFDLPDFVEKSQINSKSIAETMKVLLTD